MELGVGEVVFCFSQVHTPRFMEKIPLPKNVIVICYHHNHCISTPEAPHTATF
jgi:hypothetical protein